MCGLSACGQCKWTFAVAKNIWFEEFLLSIGQEGGIMGQFFTVSHAYLLSIAHSKSWVRWFFADKTDGHFTLVHEHCLCQYQYLVWFWIYKVHCFSTPISMLLSQCVYFLKHKPFQGITHHYQRKKVFNPLWTAHLAIMLGLNCHRMRLNTSNRNGLPLERHQAQHLQVVLEAYLEILSSWSLEVETFPMKDKLVHCAKFIITHCSISNG